MYESEVVIPAEIGLTSYRVDNHDEGRNDEAITTRPYAFNSI